MILLLLGSVIWVALLVFCVNRATKNAYQDGYDIGYLAGSNGWEREAWPPPPPPARPIVRKSTITTEEINSFLNRERIKI